MAKAPEAGWATDPPCLWRESSKARPEMGMASNSKAVSPAKTPSKGRQRNENLKGGLPFLAPALILFGVFVVFPMIKAFQLSFFDWDGLSEQKAFVGLSNYVYIFTKDPVFWRAVRNTLVWVILSLIIPTSLGLGIAMAMNQQLAGRNVFRTIFYLPAVLAAIDWLVQTLALAKNPLPQDLDLSDRSVAREQVAALAGHDHQAACHIDAARKAPATLEAPGMALTKQRTAARRCRGQHRLRARGEELLLCLGLEPADVHDVGEHQRHEPACRSALPRQPFAGHVMRAPVQAVATESARHVQPVQARSQQRRNDFRHGVAPAFGFERVLAHQWRETLHGTGQFSGRRDPGRRSGSISGR